MRRLADFEGDWTLSREIRHRDGTRFRFEGVARFRPDGDGLAYTETGHLSGPSGPPVRAERRYRWAAGLDVHFEDGRFFHRVPAGGGSARHDCPPDDYRVHYDFDRWPDWSATWEVRGPAKDYRMVSRYARAP